MGTEIWPEENEWTCKLSCLGPVNSSVRQKDSFTSVGVMSSAATLVSSELRGGSSMSCFSSVVLISSDFHSLWSWSYQLLQALGVLASAGILL